MLTPVPSGRPHTIVAVAILSLCGCGDRRVQDSELGSLVVAEAPQRASIDVERATIDVNELRRALAHDHRELTAELAGHRFVAGTAVTVSSAGQIVERVSDETTIVVDGSGNFSATSDNNHDYGRHAIYVDGMLYLRPRYGKYHRREPARASEPETILDEMSAATSATFELLYSAAKLSDGGAATVAGRAARVIEISTSSTPTERDSETLGHKKWRESISVSDVSGTISLDSENGFALAADLRGTLSFVKKSKQFTMKLTAAHAIEVAQPGDEISRPSSEEFVSTPTMRSEADEQRELLEGLSPAGGSGQAGQ